MKLITLTAPFLMSNVFKHKLSKKYSKIEFIQLINIQIIESIET